MEKYKAIGVVLESSGPLRELDPLIVDVFARSGRRLYARQCDFILDRLPKPTPPVQAHTPNSRNLAAIVIAARTLYFMSRGEPLPVDWLFSELQGYASYTAEYLDGAWSLTVRGLSARGQDPAKSKKAVVWTPEMDSMLGTVSDLSLASRWKINPSSVRARRASLGIPPLRRSGQIEDALLEGLSVEEVATLTKRSYSWVVRVRARMIKDGELEATPKSPSRSRATG